MIAVAGAAGCARIARDEPPFRVVNPVAPHRVDVLADVPVLVVELPPETSDVVADCDAAAAQPSGRRPALRRSVRVENAAQKTSSGGAGLPGRRRSRTKKTSSGGAGLPGRRRSRTKKTTVRFCVSTAGGERWVSPPLVIPRDWEVAVSTLEVRGGQLRWHRGVSTSYCAGERRSRMDSCYRRLSREGFGARQICGAEMAFDMRGRSLRELCFKIFGSADPGYSVEHLVALREHPAFTDEMQLGVVAQLQRLVLRDVPGAREALLAIARTPRQPEEVIRIASFLIRRGDLAGIDLAIAGIDGDEQRWLEVLARWREFPRSGPVHDRLDAAVGERLASSDLATRLRWLPVAAWLANPAARRRLIAALEEDETAMIARASQLLAKTPAAVPVDRQVAAVLLRRYRELGRSGATWGIRQGLLLALASRADAADLPMLLREAARDPRMAVAARRALERGLPGLASALPALAADADPAVARVAAAILGGLIESQPPAPASAKAWTDLLARRRQAVGLEVEIRRLRGAAMPWIPEIEPPTPADLEHSRDEQARLSRGRDLEFVVRSGPNRGADQLVLVADSFAHLDVWFVARLRAPDGRVTRLLARPAVIEPPRRRGCDPLPDGSGCDHVMTEPPPPYTGTVLTFGEKRSRPGPLFPLAGRYTLVLESLFGHHRSEHEVLIR